MAKLIKMINFLLYNIYQLSGTVIYGTNDDNDRLATLLPNGIILWVSRSEMMILYVIVLETHKIGASLHHFRGLYQTR